MNQRIRRAGGNLAPALLVALVVAPATGVASVSYKGWNTTSPPAGCEDIGDIVGGPGALGSFAEYGERIVVLACRQSTGRYLLRIWLQGKHGLQVVGELAVPLPQSLNHALAKHLLDATRCDLNAGAATGTTELDGPYAIGVWKETRSGEMVLNHIVAAWMIDHRDYTLHLIPAASISCIDVGD